MPYTISRTNGTQIAVIADGTVDQSTSLKLVGKNYAGYGAIQNENFVYLLENFASNSSPVNPLPGQIWFDTSIVGGKLRFWDGSKYRTTGGSEISPTQPAGLTVGDLWYDSTNSQLNVCVGTNQFLLVGPQTSSAFTGQTQWISTSVLSDSNVSHPIIKAVNNGVTVAIMSDSTFKIGSGAGNTITGFTEIHQGITLAYTNDSQTSPVGVTQPSTPQGTAFRFWGTASNADLLGGLPASSFVQGASGNFANPVTFSDQGFTVGSKLSIFNNGSIPTIKALLNDEIDIQVTYNSAVYTSAKFTHSNIQPSAAGQNDLGTQANYWGTVWATAFKGGVADAATGLYFNSATILPDYGANTNTVAIRTATSQTVNGITATAGSLAASYFIGTATMANYADLAEKYLCDQEYTQGTVVCVGGEKEVTATNIGDKAIGAVSTNPGVMMNSEQEGGTFIALKGRIPVKVTGPVVKGQRLVAGPNGTAQATFGPSSDVFAVALETSYEAGVRLVECVIL